MARRYYASAGAGILTLVNINAKTVVILFVAICAAVTVVRPLSVHAFSMVSAAEVSILHAFVDVECTVVTTPQQRSRRVIVETVTVS